MLYDKYNNSEFSEELFKNPTSEYRGAPFWAWNSKLDPDVLRDQVDIFRDMGFGGFHMHVRQGLETEYLGKDFFKAVNACVDRAEENDMLAWLYDEDRWPSGAAGGILTKTIKYRVKSIILTTRRMADSVKDYHDAIETGCHVFIAAFSINVDEDGLLVSYRRVDEDEECENKRYFYCRTAPGGEQRYNFQSYGDLLSKEAMEKFKEITYEAFLRESGDRFGSTIPAIFTDEPQTKPCNTLKSGHTEKAVDAAWTWDFPETFQEKYGFDIVERLPEIFYKTKDEGDLSPRYCYYRHLADRFSEAFFETLGTFCEKNNIMLTGHLMCEDTLLDITKWCFDPMRMYSYMQLPGIDVLCDRRLFVTAKQCESVARQMGKPGVLSELYGVTNWDYDFKNHKSQGDWQACLGVTVRVPHLAWQTMKGEGKRDYPASIYYQSPWYREYKIIEDHFSRVHTALARGKAVSHVGVLHPIESFWTKYCSEAESHMECRELNDQFLETCNWLLLGSCNFDYIAESLLEELCKAPTCPLKVGKMEYDTIILDNCFNLRPYTINALKKFAEAGGKLIISGRAPSMSLAKPSEEAKSLLPLAKVISHTKTQLLDAIASDRDVTIRNSDGAPTGGLLYTRRTEGDTDWLFVCNAYKPELSHNPTRQSIVIKVKGLYRAILYNTITGEREQIAYSAKGGATKIYASIFDYDSLLIKLEKISADETFALPEEKIERRELVIPTTTDFRLSEPNVLLLDTAEWRVGDGKLNPKEEIMRIDEMARTALELPLRRTKCVQPWAVSDVPEVSTLYLRYTFKSEIEYKGALLALETLEKSTVSFNGKAVDNTAVGHYVDREIHTCALPEIVKGENVLEVSMPIGIRTDVENCFILGSFGTGYRGREVYITDMPKDLAYGDIVHQGLAFYGANVIYDTELTLDEDSCLEFEISYYRGALIRVDIDGAEAGYIWKSPFRLVTDTLKAGKHKVTYTLFGNRYNTFAALHNLLADKKEVYVGPDYWRSAGFAWSYEYQTRPMGILKAPIVRKYKKV